MKPKKLLILQLFIMLLTLSINAQEVNTRETLYAAISSAVPGTTIVIADGTYTDTFINLKVTGTAANPVIIKAKNPGQVFFEGNSRVAMGGAYIKLEGIIFRNASNLTLSSTTVIEPVIKFRFDSNNTCTNCTVTNVKIDSYNGTTAQSTTPTLIYKWVLLYGQYNEISYCSFTGKNGAGSTINDNRDVATPNYTKIHHNYFGDRTFVGTYVDQYNDQDAIRIGNSNTSLSDSFTEVYENLFSNWFGEIEIISNKSGNNKYYNNTFSNYSGTLTLRHGNKCEVFGNYFLANNQLFSGGIRVLGEDHKIYNNYIENVNSAKSSAAGGGTSSNLGALNLIGGIATSVNGANLSGYYQVKNITILNNTFVNNDFGIRLGGGSYTLPALNMVAANNIFLMPSSSKKAVDEIRAADASSPYTFTGNIKQSGVWTLNGNAANNQEVSSGLLATSSDNVYRLTAGSAAIDAGIGTYSYLTKDIFDGNRPALYDAGAEEFGADGSRLPYTVADVGVKVGFFGSANLSVVSNRSNSQNLVLYPNPITGEYLNVYFGEKILGKIQIINMLGKVVIEKLIDESNGKIDVTSLQKGVYTVKVQGASKLFIK
ncbi:chondroitinase-B domain-containing protein [Flavobacterium algicola]|uniref:chondroitinase-B domain-containing protein n=1 Tax=Flavobacterium algicola TaxID=556529 RepID=UPI001EFCBAF2|nr:chondroitinase-B domain-containing protein [Flavobacterium algicola]MCG9792018.1 T9SS type A sorting domain-containing protein [Flavobacterium algicola]